MKNAHIDVHVHPFFCNNSILNIETAMNETFLDVVGLESLDYSIFPKILEEIKMYYSEFLADEAGVKLPSNKYILNAREYNTKEGIHILTVGYSYDEANKETPIKEIIERGLENDAFVLLDHPFVDNVETRTAGHISEEKEKFLETLCEEYSGNIALEWNAYCVPWIRKGLQIGLNLFGKNITYHDVNKKVEDLSEFLKSNGYNVPVIADTDLHARNTRHLSVMGTARFITDIEGETPREVVASMKKNIFDGNYTNQKNYVSSLHLLENFCVPVLIPKLYPKPRA